FLIFTVCLAAEGVYPFGDNQIINYDGWHQYYPFVMKLWDHFHEGTSLLYDWSMGMGTNFLSMLAYYGSSPMNLLLIFVPVRDFRLLFMLFSVIRIGLAGLFTALFLRKVFKNSGWSVVFFSLGYALSGYILGYFWNNMWLDSVALYPLLCLATVKLFREGKSSLYIFVLALSLFSNYYIGYMSCVFTVLVFFVLCIIDRVTFSNFIRKGFRFALASIWGGALTAVLLLPAFYGLFNTFSTTDGVPLYVSFYESVRDLIAPLASFHAPAVMDGLPNITTAASLSLFAFAFLWAKNISLKEKLCAFFLVVFLLVSMNFSVLNYFWHGFHFTNMIPYRFAFLFAFVIVVMAYRYYQKAVMTFDAVDAIGMLFFSALVIFCALGYYDNVSILATTAVFALCLILSVLASVKLIPRKVFSVCICLILTVEIVFASIFGTQAVGVSGYSGYYDSEKGEEVISMVKIAEKAEEGKNDFFRLETTEWRSLNDSCFYDYNGISQFASSANCNVSEFLQHLGMPADPGSNRFVYVHGTPLADTLMGVKYLINKNGTLTDKGLTCISPATNDVVTTLYENLGFAGLGFMMEEAAGKFDFDDTATPYEKQNALFSAITGLEGDLLTPLSPTQANHMNVAVEDLGGFSYEYTGAALGEEETVERVIRFSYTSPDNNMIYIYADVPLSSYMQVNNGWHCIEEYPNFFSAGSFRAEESFQVRAVIQEESKEEFTDYARIYVCAMDQDLWEEGIQRLQDEKMQIETFEDTYVKGKVQAKKSGYLYTSIPMELEGNWKVLVDGKEAEVTPFTGAFVGLYLSSGEHTVEFEYSPKGYVAGAWISSIFAILLIALFLWERKGHRLFPDKIYPMPEEIKEENLPEEDCAQPLEEKEKEGSGEIDASEIDVNHTQGS
ncbi:MAG: YfhO family protein, partial [Clostridia bacterium]|nr:YfhO family protein [Clostridia bacterium]